MHSLSDRRRLLERAFGGTSLSSDGINIAVSCPKCAKDNRKKKLVIRIDDGRYHCWVCGLKGKNIVNLFERYKQGLVNDAKRWADSAGIRRSKSTYDNEKKENIVNAPNGFMLLALCQNSRDPDVRETFQYVRTRGVSISNMWHYRLGTCKTGKYRRRVIIPSFDVDGELNYITARSIDDSRIPKYLNSKVPKTDIIINEINIDWKEELTLVEGPFDLLKCNLNATCLLGSYLSQKSALFTEIVKNMTPVLLALDPDADEKSHKIARDLYSFGIDIRMAKIIKGDVGDMSLSEFDEIRSKAGDWSDITYLQSKIRSIKTGSLI